MISFTAIVKAGAVCVSLLGPEVQFCTKDGMADLVCDLQTDRCQSERDMTADWKDHPEKRMEFLKKLYGYNERTK